MATVGPYYSTEYTLNYRTVPPDVAVHRNKQSNVRGKIFSYTQAATGTDGDLVYLCRLPAGSRILLPLSYIYVSAWSASTVLDVGWAAYVDPTGAAVVADPDGLIDGLDISNAAVMLYFGQVTTVGTTNTLIQIPAALIHREFNSRSDVEITATIAGAAPLAAATIDGFIAYMA
jgi:hypothetical protein